MIARSGVGKTIVIGHALQCVAEMDHVAQVFFSLEMPGAQIGGRLQQQVYGLGTHQREEDSRLRRLDRERFTRAFGSLVIVDQPRLSVGQMDDRLTAIMDGPMRGKKLGLIAIDYLGLIGGDRSQNTYDQISLHARDVKELAKSRQCAVLLVIQVGREAGGDGSKELGLAAARDSGVVEEAVDYLVGFRRLERSLTLSTRDRERYHNLTFAKASRTVTAIRTPEKPRIGSIP